MYAGTGCKIDMTYPKTHSLLDPQISAGLSTQIVVKVGGTVVGAIQSITFPQAREMHVFEEIGTEGVVEVCPKGAAKVTVTVERLVFDGLRLPEALARGFINIQAQRYPFDIQIIDTTNGDIDQSAIVTTIHGCWIKSYAPTITANAFLVSERAELQAERITTFQGGHSAVHGGRRGIAFDYDTVERSTDKNGRVGRLDAAGIALKT